MAHALIFWRSAYAQIVVFDDWRRETSRFLIALLRVKTVNLLELATGLRSSAKRESSYKLQRFFRNFELDYEAIAKVVIALMNIPQPWVLSTDRTIAYGNPPAKLSNRLRRLVIWGKTIQSSFFRSGT